MKTTLDCMPCFIRQALEAARMATDDVATHEQLMRDTLRMASSLDLAESPPVVAQRVHRRLRELTGGRDPYAKAKELFNQVALEMLPGFRKRVQDSSDPLATAVHLAIAGNMMDLGANGGLTPADVQSVIEHALSEPLQGDLDAFRRAVERSRHILYLADNAGEIVLDRVLVEALAPAEVTVAVHGGAVLNDATLEDAHIAGLDEVASVTDNGSDAPGTVLSDCSFAFQQLFDEADMVMAKGQGNYETLSGEEREVFFLLRVKCPVIADHTGLAVGDSALLRSAPISHPAST